MRRLLTVTLVLASLACASSPAPPSSPAPRSSKVRIEFTAGFGSASDGKAEGWLGYAMARITGPPAGSTASPSLDPPPFEEEAYARESLALIWGELALEHGYSDRYFSQLVEIQSAGFMREYTWSCLRVASGPPPPDLRISEFRAWVAGALPEHVVESWSFAVPQDGEVVLYVGQAAHEPYVCEPSD